MFDKFKEECGVFGIYGHPEAAHLTYLGIHALQHRGQESAGIVSFDGKEFYQEKGMGLVSEVFSESKLRKLMGYMAVGHNRYSTTGESFLKNAQPLVMNYALGTLAIAHNGNLINGGVLRDELEAYGSIFHTTVDTEVIMHLVAHSKEKALLGRVIDALRQVRGAFSLLFLSDEGLIAVRDPHGFRPLSLGRLKDAYVVSSETCSFDLIEADFVRDIEPGELVLINRDGISSLNPFSPSKQASCVFEYVYFSRPDSIVYGQSVHNIRKQLGKQLAMEKNVNADLVIAVPDSGVQAALGFAEGANLPYEMGLIRSHYVGRTFIEPQQSIRHFGVKLKLNAVRSVIEGQRVVVVDDSIVRGTTARKIIKMIRNAGAKEVHVRISSPPIVSPCFYGIDTPRKGELIASSQAVEKIRDFITADTLEYLSVEGLLKAAGGSKIGFCTACFTENYPIPITRENNQLDLF
ncbi:MAG TPA: amidophosphoribosyltransferase [Nitrospiria bacterium]|jgi:amidophosphoribosyltransferase